MNWLCDCLIRIKNAGLSSKPVVSVRGTKFCLKVLNLLKEEGFISNFEIDKNQISLKQGYKVNLKYYKEVPLVKDVNFISTSKNRVYKKSGELKKYMNDFKFAAVSTDKGVMSAKDAIERKLGGEVLFWLGNN